MPKLWGGDSTLSMDVKDKEWAEGREHGRVDVQTDHCETIPSIRA